MSVEQIGRYQVTSEVGKGAMGVVYQALDPTIGRVVALKTMRVDVSGMAADELLRRFRNEARAAGVLNHPNLVTIFDAGEQDGLFYIAMEYIEGQTLQQLLLERNVLPVEQVIDIARQVCAGLDYAHARGVVHRDIKPANIMITADGTVKIMDFGIAKADGGFTCAGRVLGTPNYMSPEQVKGKPIDGRADLFSVAVMLYEMLIGEKPFVGQNVTTIIYKIVNERPIPPRELDVTVHPGLSAVVTRALAKDPDERFQTGAELARELQSYKSFGATGEATIVLDAAAWAAAPVAASGTGVATAVAPARMAEPVAAGVAVTPGRKPTTPVHRPRPSIIQVIAGVGLLALAAFGAGYFRYVVTRVQPPVQSTTNSESQAPVQPTEPVKPANLAGDLQPAPPPSTGELRLETRPSGARVQIDGRGHRAWITPVTISSLRPGSHTVKVSKPGFVSEIRGVDVELGKRTRLEIALPERR